MRAAFDKTVEKSSEIVVINQKADISELWPNWADQIISRGYAILSIESGMQNDFQALQRLAENVSFREKQEFCFIDRTDGYFPVGYSHIGAENRDRCEIFNYWYRFRDEHKQYAFNRSEFYSRIVSYEAQVSAYGQALVDEIRKRYGYVHKIQTRNDS